jgi:hypothetical protein
MSIANSAEPSASKRERFCGFFRFCLATQGGRTASIFSKPRRWGLSAPIFGGFVGLTGKINVTRGLTRHPENRQGIGSYRLLWRPDSLPTEFAFVKVRST